MITNLVGVRFLILQTIIPENLKQIGPLEAEIEKYALYGPQRVKWLKIYYLCIIVMCWVLFIFVILPCTFWRKFQKGRFASSLKLQQLKRYRKWRLSTRKWRQITIFQDRKLFLNGFKLISIDLKSISYEKLSFWPWQFRHFQ